MDKKLFFSLFAATGMLFATSCSNDELEAVRSGNEAQVTFSLGLEGGIATRAISDGTGAKKLICAIYDANDASNKILLDKVVINDQQVDANGQYVNTSAFQGGLKDNVRITLAKGQTYTMVFWAQNGACDAYDTDDLTAVEVDYTDGAETDAKGDINNDETRDAFYAAETFKVEGDKEINVTLKRPFAQINVGVYQTDWDAAVASGIEIEKSSVVIKNAATSINLLTGEVGEETTDVVVSYTSNTIPNETLYVETDATQEGKEAYKWLSMSYILVADHDATVDENGLLGTDKAILQGLQYTFTPTSGQPITFEEGLAGAPVRRNWRTNILGKILTGDIQFNITIDPAYDGDYIYPSKVEEELEFAATFGGTVTLNDNVTLNAPLNVTKDMILNLNGKTITNKADNTQTDVIIVKEGATLEINGDGNVIAVSGNDGYAVISEGTLIINGGTFTSGTDGNGDGNATIYARGKGQIYIKGGKFKNDGDDTAFLVNKKDADRATTTIEITGGSFYKFDPANCASEGAGTDFVKEGHTSVANGDWFDVIVGEYTVVSTSEALVTAFTNGGNILLASNIELGTQLKLAAGTNVHLNMNGKKITVTDSSVDPAFYTYQGSTLTIDGNGTVELSDPYMSLMFPAGDVVIENGTFTRNVPEGTPANQVGAFFVGAKVSPWGSSSVTINGGYFDGGYYDANAADIDGILAGDATFTETKDDITKRGVSTDKNTVRVALKNNIQLLLNKSSNNFIIYGGTFVGANPAWGDEGCMLPTTPNYLRPWSYYQGAMLDGQTFNENGIVLPEGYTITKGATEKGVPTYTVTYSK